MVGNQESFLPLTKIKNKNVSLKLSDQEIQTRLWRLSNLERLYANLKEKYHKLEAENRELKMVILRQGEIIEQQQLRIEELEKMVFGRKKKKNDNDQVDSQDQGKIPRSPANRPPDSFRRQTPSLGDITETKHYPITTCPDCGTSLTRVKTVVRYIEDILPLQEWYQKLKQVVKQEIVTGFCPCCQARKTAIPISPQNVSLGENVKQFVTFSTIILRHSYEQIKDFLSSAIHFKLSDGEITNILTEQGIKLHPEFEALKERIRGQPGAHFDETSWTVQITELGNYVWVNCGTKTPETVFLFGRSRGKGNIAELTGKDPPKTQTAITDDYGAYKNTFSKHQLCWSHPYRKFRDLAYSESLPPTKKKHCLNIFEQFSQLYADLKDVLATSFNLPKREQQKKKLMHQFNKVIITHSHEPVKLSKIKERLRERKEHYFTCITEKDIPCDNNKAERALRHLVLKRKSCFGSKTQRSADLASVLYSVLLSLWWKSKETFFQNYSALLASV